MKKQPKKKQAQTDFFLSLAESASAEHKELLQNFLSDFDMHCNLPRKEKKLLRGDFEAATRHYLENGLSVEEALDRLDPKFLGGFYTRPATLWFPLDDAAKIYPLSMKHGTMSQFRLSAKLKSPVIPELLQMALNCTVQRYPCFATTLKKGFFWHYLDATKRRFPVEKEHGVPCQPMKIAMTGSPAFRVLYWENRVSLEFSHILTDGMGSIAFLKSLLSEYFRLCGVKVELNGLAWDVREAPSLEEFENAFAKIPAGFHPEGFMGKVALQMNGPLSETLPCRILHFRMKAEDLVENARKRSTKVTSYVLALMFLALKSSTDELEGDISIQVPFNMRKYHPTKSVRNFSMFCGIRLPLTKITAVEEILPEINRQLEEKTSPEALSNMVAGTERLIGLLRYIPLAIKGPVAKFIYGFMGDRIFTNTLSNPGTIVFPPAVAEQVESMDAILGTTVTNRAGCSLVTCNGIATFTVTKNTVDPTFEEKMLELFTQEGIKVTVEGSPLYEC